MGRIIDIIIVSVFICLSSTAFGLYLIADYYMDPDWPSSFDGICGRHVQDSCLFVNSHLNTFGIANYGDDKDCTMTLDAGGGARYRLDWRRFKVEGGDCSKDYLELYDADMFDVNMSSHLIGRYCGRDTPNITGYPTQQFLTLKFHTDGSTEDKGFRILTTRTESYPCSDDQYHCKADNSCIDGRLKCDGTVQCADELDESGCTWFEVLIGGLLALGLAGIIGVVGAVLVFCTALGVTICALTCCRKQCGACCQGVSRLCKTCSSRVSRAARGVKQKVVGPAASDQPEKPDAVTDTDDSLAMVVKEKTAGDAADLMATPRETSDNGTADPEEVVPIEVVPATARVGTPEQRENTKITGLGANDSETRVGVPEVVAT